MKKREVVQNEIDLLRLFKAILRRAWAVVLAAVIFGAGSFLYSRLAIDPLYQAGAMMYVNNSSLSVGSTSLSISGGDLSTSQTLVDTYLVILKTRTTLEAVIKEAKLSCNYATLNAAISASAVGNTPIFRIVVTWKNPVEAERIANAVAKVLPDKISDVVDGTSARVVEHAVVPARKASPNITKNTMYGLLAGAAFACAVIVLLELFDDLIRSEDYLTQTYDVPILATIPELAESSGHGKSYGYGYGYGQKSKQEGEDKK